MIANMKKTLWSNLKILISHKMTTWGILLGVSLHVFLVISLARQQR